MTWHEGQRTGDRGQRGQGGRDTLWKRSAPTPVFEVPPPSFLGLRSPTPPLWGFVPVSHPPCDR